MVSGKVAAVLLPALRVSSLRDGDTHVIVLAGELDLATMEGVERALERVERTDARVIVIDLRQLDFIACSGLRVIVRAHRRLAGRLTLVRGPRFVQRVFEIFGLVDVLPFVDEPPRGASADRSPPRPRTEGPRPPVVREAGPESGLGPGVG